MEPAEYDITLRIGLAFEPLVLTCQDADGIAVDLTGYTAFAEVRAKAASAVILDLKPVITDGPAGEITIELTDEQMDEVTARPGQYYWDLVLESPEGVRTGPYIAGRALVLRGITQPN